MSRADRRRRAREPTPVLDPGYETAQKGEQMTHPQLSRAISALSDAVNRLAELIDALDIAVARIERQEPPLAS